MQFSIMLSSLHAMVASMYSAGTERAVRGRFRAANGKKVKRRRRQPDANCTKRRELCGSRFCLSVYMPYIPTIFRPPMACSIRQHSSIWKTHSARTKRLLHLVRNGIGIEIAVDGFAAIERIGFYIRNTRRHGSKARIGHGACVSLCQRGNYDMTSRGVRTEGDCEFCFACIQNCPQKAIRFNPASGQPFLANGEKNPNARFRNEHISLMDIKRANNQK